MKRKRQPAKFDRCVKEVKARGGAVSPYAVCKASIKNRGKKKGKRNPAEEAAKVYEEFHGRPPGEVVKVTQQVHFHRHLAGAGELKYLVIDAVDKKHRVKLKQFKGAILAFNEKKNQLFVRGGDQHVNLEDFGIDPRKAHEVETLGRSVDIGYDTRKDHLGPEGGKGVYGHHFRTTNENGKHVLVKIARYPDVIYYVLDEQLVFSGGSYEIRAEGIDK